MLSKKIILLLAFLPLAACVKKKIYRSELNARRESEARESVLLRQSIERKKELDGLVKQIGDLNRTIGTLEEQARSLQLEVVAKSQKFGESEGRLSSRNQELQRQVEYLSDSLSRIEKTLAHFREAELARRAILGQNFTDLAEKLQDWFVEGVELDLTDNALRLTLPDNKLFEANGTAISGTGRSLLEPIADFIFNRPDLEVEIHAHVDNSVPKNMKDSWEWSLSRSINLTRLLVRELNVNANQLMPVAKGEFEPLSSNETTEGRSKNRRTVLVLKPLLPTLSVMED